MVTRQLIIWHSTSFKEQSAHVTSVKNILESHARYLMSGKELSKLVAFVKGTQFDVVVCTPKIYVISYVDAYYVFGD